MQKSFEGKGKEGKGKLYLFGFLILASEKFELVPQIIKISIRSPNY